MLIFTQTKWIYLDYQILSCWNHFETHLVDNNIWKKSKFYRLNCCQYEFAFMKANFKWFFSITGGLSVATMYDTDHYFVFFLPWQPFESRFLFSWELFVMTSRENIEFLVHNHYKRDVSKTCQCILFHVVKCISIAIDNDTISNQVVKSHALYADWQNWIKLKTSNTWFHFHNHSTFTLTA